MIITAIVCYILGHNPRPVPGVSIQDQPADGTWLLAIVCARCGKEIELL